MTTPNDAARPVAWSLQIGDSDAIGFCDDESDADFYGHQSGLPYKKQALYAAADYDALQAEVALTQAEFDAVWTEAIKYRARAEAAEAKVAAFMECLPEVESRIRAAVKCMPGSKQCVIAKIELDEAGAWLAALNEGGE